MAVVVVVVSWDLALEKVPRRKELGHQFHCPACQAVECLHLQAAQAPKVQVQELGVDHKSRRVATGSLFLKSRRNLMLIPKSNGMWLFSIIGK